MKDKKNLLITIPILIILIIILIFINSNRQNLFLKFFNQATSNVTNKLDYKTISGNAKFKLNSGSNLKKQNKIIENVDYEADYQVDLKKGYINIDTEGNYDKKLLNSNIYISDNKINILLENIFDKYIVYNNKYLDILNNPSDYKNIISILNQEINSLLKSKHFTKKKVKLNDKKVTKITLDLTKNYYDDLKDKLIKKLSKNKSFMKSLSNIYDNKYTNKELISKMNKVDISDTKISLYTTRLTKKFIKFEIDSKELDIEVEYKNNRYNIKYIIRDGLIYEAYLKLDRENIKEFNIINKEKNYYVNLKFDELNIKYNKKVDSFKKIKSSDEVNYLELSEKDKTIIKKSDIINNIYDNYLNRNYYKEREVEIDTSPKVIIDERDY